MATLTYETTGEEEATLLFAAQDAGLARETFVAQFVGSALAQLRATLHADHAARTIQAITEALDAGETVEVVKDAQTGFPVATRKGGR
jgi:hypothetical protein